MTNWRTTGANWYKKGVRQLHLPYSNWRTGALAQTSARVAQSGAAVTIRRWAGGGELEHV